MDMLEFLNHYLPKLITEVKSVAEVFKTEFSPNSNWKVKVVCLPNTMDECNQFKLIEKLQTLIRSYGEECFVCSVEINYEE